MKTTVSFVCQSSDCRFRVSLNLSAFCLKKGANWLIKLSIVTWETLIPEFIIKNYEIALVDELFRKYKVNDVNTTWSGNRISFTERDPVTKLLDA